jgi:molybdopterin/thiamine biosynthesis adenylyltransferase
MNEDFYDRLRLQKNWNLAQFAEKQLVICGDGGGMTRTLALAAVCCGWPRVAFVGAPECRSRLVEAAEEVTLHVGPPGYYAPVYPAAYAVMAPSHPQVWVIDAGDPRYDGLEPANGQAFYYSEGRSPDGSDFIAFGFGRKAVARDRKGTPVKDRAEIPAACALLLTGIFAEMKVCDELAKPVPVCRIPLPNIPEAAGVPILSILYAGGGGAIAHQEIWAAHLDPVLRKAARGGRAAVVDPKLVHESCRSRQWGYGPETLHQLKAEMTALWLKRLFPGLRVQVFNDRLQEKHLVEHAGVEALASIDNWSGRKLLAALCSRFGLPWWSAGSSFMGGFARQVSAANPACASADEGVERLSSRPEDNGQGGGTSCTAAETPQPSSVLPQMVIGSYIACSRREVLLGRADPRALARGIEVHLTHPSWQRGFEGLLWSPGRMVNIKQQRALPFGERSCKRAASGF